MTWSGLALVLIAYLVGSIPFGYLLVRWAKGLDVRAHGSGNIGMTNVWRVAGAGWGMATLVLDIAKGVLAVGLSHYFYPESEFLGAACGLLALIGNIFSVFLKFQGGKGIGISVGVFFSLLPLESAVGTAVFLLALLLTRMISVGSLGGVTTMALLSLYYLGFGWYSGLALVAALMVWWTHRQNLQRIMRGTENRIGRKKTATNRKKH